MEVGGGGDGGAVGGGGKLGGGGTVVELRRNLENPSFWALDFRFQIFLFWVFYFFSSFLVVGLTGIEEESNLERGENESMMK